MSIAKTFSVCFSPTGTTRKILGGILEGFGAAADEHIDLTHPGAGEKDPYLARDDFAFIGSPVYAGRLPSIVVQRLKMLKGNETPAAIVVVYGNRAYEDALLELSDLTRGAGFIPIAAGAFIGEHSYSTQALPVAQGRPDAEDMARARDFGALIRKKMMGMQGLGGRAPVTLPGNFPYKDVVPLKDISPIVLDDLCNLCGLCAPVCPTAAITVQETVQTDKDLCIRCCACVKSCPTEARIMDDPQMRKIAQWLSETFQERKAPEIFL